MSKQEVIFWQLLATNHQSASLSFIFLLNKVVFPQIFRFYLVFLCYRLFIDIWFIVALLQCGVVHHLVATFYLYKGDLDR